MPPKGSFPHSDAGEGAIRELLGSFEPGSVLLDTARITEEDAATLLFCEPSEVLVARTLDEVAAVIDRLDGAVRSGCWSAGFLSYEAAYAFLPKLSGEAVALPDVPLAWFGVYEKAKALSPEVTRSLLGVQRYSGAGARNVALDCSREAYRECIEAIREYVYEGDVYQINFTDAFTFEIDGEPLELYRALRANQQVSYAALINTGDEVVLSFSPELFFRRDGRRIWTRPMKGTVRRGQSQEEDDQLRQWLEQDEKTRAENLMIVDLLRNDLSVVCEPGSVEVPALFTPEQYETLFQLTSTVQGQLKRPAGYADIFRALFPCGSVTGAPKLRAMQRILELERRPRGVYCGAIGYVAPEERAVFSVAIRTIVARDGRGRMGTGSGIVWDSDPDQEYDECLLKGAFLKGTVKGNATKPVTREHSFELIETMRCEGGEIALLPYHLERLAASADYFGRPFDEKTFLNSLREQIAQVSEGRHVIRALLHPDGAVSVESRPLPDEAGFRRVGWARQPVDSRNPLLQHKTTQRDVFEQAFEEAQLKGLDEVIFLNERGEVTEGTRTNLFIERDGCLHTPPVICGLLPGVFRTHVLETRREAAEKVLYPEDVLEADAAYLCNAVRGWCKVQVASPLPQADHSKA